ncbi:predicted protein [Nematostella vectensis]|uniref:Nucleoredoxin n=1 Tax=Nematostella vectensis TaxID=45351 RepID=A7S2B8_NEMVE|nr:predicted protein [Nematostella vectensis]|eukprot:XP_001634149.1 predicted protein [Nematostella vectensis]
MAKALESLLGKNLVGKHGQISVESLSGEGKIVGLYFSAHWCPPCRGFTPKLVEFYQNYRSKTNNALEVVFISSDKDEGQFNNYFKEMPWLSLPFSERERKKKLSQKFKIAGIPTLVLLEGKDGSVITRDGRGALIEDQEGKNFPWRPKPLSEIISGSLVNKNGEVINAGDLKGKIVGIYFSAHWCPPCRAFTPELVSTYDAVRKANNAFEVIFVSSDRSQDSFKDYLNTMPWFAIPYEDSDRRLAVSKHFGVEGIPTFIIVDENWKIISTNGRTIVLHDKLGKEFPWRIKPYDDLNPITALIVNEETCAIYFADGEEETLKQAREMFQPLADKIAKDAAEKGEDRPITFLCARNDEVAESLREFASLPDDENILVILDIPSRRVFVSDNDVITTDNAREFVNNYLADKLQGRLLH